MPFIVNNIDMRGCITCQYYEIDRKFKVLGNRRIIEAGATSAKCRLLDARYDIHKNIDRTPPPMGCSYNRWIELPD
ncbi:MAG: hypothetical protein GX937_12315 [Lentisphaerae bacterium]|nr:hypothetical protein [Lentisphaerota bacterium]